MKNFLLYLYAESPLHAGAPDSSGVLDLPIQREATTGYPVVWGQSLKGALRQAARDAQWSREDLVTMFGDEPGEVNDESAAGLLTVGDAQLVALPVPTLQRTFAWATSEIALSRLARKYARTALAAPSALPAPEVAPEEALSAGPAWEGKTAGVLGPYRVSVKVAPGGPSNPVSVWGKRLACDAIGPDPHMAPFAAKMCEDLLLVGADVMPGLVRECTEFATRVQLDPETKTVVHGPFSSEYLPAETILAAALTLNREAHKGEKTADEELLSFLLTELLGSGNRILQIGGDETIGKGITWVRLLEGGK